MPTGQVNEIGFMGINVQQNPDLFLTTAMTPLKIEVGYFSQSSLVNNVGYVTGLAFDPNNQIVWFTGKTNLRGWGYAYDISTYANNIGVILADTDPYYNRAIYRYAFSEVNEIPQFVVSPGLASDYIPPETFQKISVGRFGYLALSENYYWPYGENYNGELGIDSSYTDTLSENLKNGLNDGVIGILSSVTNPTDISAGGYHSLLIASNVKPSTNTFTFVRTGGYPTPDILTIYPTQQTLQ